MIESAAMINDRMPEYTVERLRNILNRECKSIKNSKILALGVAYKQDIDDYRESPAIRVIEIMEKFGAIVDYFDPFVPFCKKGSFVKKSIASISPETIASYDGVVILTAHTKIDYSMVQENAKFIFDTKNATKHLTSRNNIELL